VSDRRRPVGDPEILELFADEPELLAVTDAIHATYREPIERGWRRPVLVLAAAFVLALAAAALWPRGDGFVETALAAVGDEPVIHSVVRRPAPRIGIVDVASGRERAASVEVETWYDTRSGSIRTITRVDGVVVADARGAGTARLAGGEQAQLLTLSYRRALEANRARLNERARLGDREVVWLVVPTGAGRQRVAVDAASHEPVAFEPEGGARWTVVELTSVPAREGLLTPRATAPAPASGQVTGRAPTSPGEAGRTPWAAWLGPRLGRHPLTSLRRETLSRRLSDGRQQHGTGLEFVYGSRRDGISLRVAPRPEPAYGYVEGRLTFNFGPIPPKGKLAVRTPSSGDVWLGQLRYADAFITLRAPSRDLLLAAARQLRPL